MLIRTNALRSMVEADVGGRPVTDRWSEVSGLLTQRCGSDVAALFAEPSITRSNGASESIARWYSEAEGPAVSYSAIDAGARATASAQLTSLLSRLEPILRDPATSDLIGPCVQIPSMADVMVVGGRPVIVNWGFLPEDVALSPGRRETHFRTTLGQFLPGVAVPPFNMMASGPGLRPTTGPASAAVPGAVQAATPSTLPPVAPAPASTPGRPWLPVAIATAIALVVLLVLLIPGVLIYPEAPRASADDLVLRREMNRTLQEYVERLQREAARQVCTVQTPDGKLTSTPAEVLTPASATGTQPLSNAQLLATLEKATVLVIVASADGTAIDSIGSGFFINEHQIVTNRHVVQSAQPGRIFVVNKALSRPVPATVIGISPGPQQLYRDFALMEVQQATGITGIALSNDAKRLDPVTAAGFTGTLVVGDQAFKKLLNGDLSSMPEMVVTQGIVMVVQQVTGGSTLVYHNATISGGNSGGPLTDACGRLVAVNTFNRIDPQRPIAFNGALAATSLAAFLEAGHISFQKVPDACGAAPQPPAGGTPPVSPSPGPATAPSAGGK